MKLNEKEKKMQTVHIGYLGFNMDHSRIQYGPKRKKKKTYMCLVTETVYLCNKKNKTKLKQKYQALDRVPNCFCCCGKQNIQAYTSKETRKIIYSCHNLIYMKVVFIFTQKSITSSNFAACNTQTNGLVGLMEMPSC